MLAWACAGLAATAAAGCSTSGDDKVEGPVSVYVSLPLTGPRGADGRDAADGARLALEQAGGRAGELEIRAHYRDDAEGGRWDPAAVGRNARTAAQDASTAAYIGELDSQPTRTSLPITNQAGIAQVSPGAGGVDLTRAAEGYPDSPDRYRPSGNATFARVIPDDAAQAAAAADWAAELAPGRVAAVAEDTPFGALIVTEFEDAAGEVGVEVVPPASAPLVFYAGGVDGLGALAGLDPPEGAIATDALPPQEGERLPGDAAYATAAALSPARLPPSPFPADFRLRFGRELGPYAAYGYEAMALVLEAIADAKEKGDEFRPDVVTALLDADRPDSILGRYSIDPDGNTTLCTIQRYALRAAAAVPLQAPCGTG